MTLIAGRAAAMRRFAGLASVLTAAMLLAAPSVSAEDGYWPEGEVSPAAVSSHRRAAETPTDPAAWGTDCNRVFQGQTRFPSGGGFIDKFGAQLDADYALVVVHAVDLGGEVWWPGDFGVTIFESPKAGQFVWADGDGNGRFGNRHEADLWSVIVCGSGMPRTDRSTPVSPPPSVSLLGPSLAALFGTLAAAAWLERLRRRWE